MVGNFYYVTEYQIMYSTSGRGLRYYSNKEDLDSKKLYTVNKAL